MKREVNMCDGNSCESLAKKICPLCEKEFCNGHFSGYVEINNKLYNKHVPGVRGIEIKAEIEFCTFCLNVLTKADNPIAKITAFEPETLRVLRAALAEAALVK